MTEADRLKIYEAKCSCDQLKLLAKRIPWARSLVRREVAAILEALAILEAEPTKKHGEWDRLSKKEMWDTIQEIREHVNSDGTRTVIGDIDALVDEAKEQGYADALVEMQAKPRVPMAMLREIWAVDLDDYPEEAKLIAADRKATVERCRVDLKMKLDGRSLYGNNAVLFRLLDETLDGVLEE